jgi:hypothetical protein
MSWACAGAVFVQSPAERGTGGFARRTSWVGGTNDGHQFARQIGVDPYGRYPVEPEVAITAGLAAGPEVMPVGPAQMWRHPVPSTVAGSAGVLGSGKTESGAEAKPCRHDDGLGPASRPPRRSRRGDLTTGDV